MGIANFLLIAIVGYLFLGVIIGLAALFLPSPNEMSERARGAFDAFYGGYVPSVALAAVVSFLRRSLDSVWLRK